MNLVDWLAEREANCLRIAKGKTGEDKQGWLEDAVYFSEAKKRIALLDEATEGENKGLRMFIALRFLRAWNSGTEGFDASLVHLINSWIDGGMEGPIPWPASPFVIQWAEKLGYSSVNGHIGFRFEAKLSNGNTKR